MITEEPRGFWAHARHLLDLRATVAFAIIVMVFRILDMIDRNPDLTDNQGFMFLAQAIVISGFIGSVLAFLFAASKTAADKAKATDAGTTISTPPGPSSVTVDTPPVEPKPVEEPK